MLDQKKSYLQLLVWITLILSMSRMIGYISRTHTDLWYRSLERSTLTPPDVIFPIVWTILYLMIAISGWLLWHMKDAKDLKVLFIAQLLCNWAWSPLFFYFHQIGWALLCLIALVLCTTLLIQRSKCKHPWAGLLLMPYLLWSLFATYLNIYIWIHHGECNTLV